jgi:hypothetical protein
MNRAIKNKVRGKQRADAADVPQVGQPYMLNQYSGRANYSAGQIDLRAIKPLQPDGALAQWQGIEASDK